MDLRVEEVSSVDSEHIPSRRSRFVDSKLLFFIYHTLRLREKGEKDRELERERKRKRNRESGREKFSECKREI